MTPNRRPLVMFVLVGLVVVAVVGLATHSWVFFGIALAVHAVATLLVVTGVVKTVQTGTEADQDSQRLERQAGEAVHGGPRNVETELEALKRQ